ncbi:MAG: hypothetical protein Q9213_000990 [Squamulea squamosa]
MAAQAPVPNSCFPPEILANVFRYSDRTDQQNVRLACQQFNELATPIVFHELILRLDMTFEEYSQRLSFPFGRYVKVARLLMVEYTPMWSRQRLLGIMGNCCDKFDDTYDAAAEQEIFQKYQELQHHHITALKTGEMLSYLTVLLLSMPNLQKVYLTDGMPRPFGINQFNEYACPHQHQASYGFNPYIGLGNAYGKLHWELLILGLTNSQTRLTELVQRTVNIFAGLTKIHLSLEFHSHSSGSGDETSTSLNPILRQAIHLRTLSITKTRGAEPTNELFELLDGCEYPKMTSLILDHCSSTEEDLLSFILRIKDLKHLHLVIYRLSVGSWEHVARTLKNEMPYLKDVRMTLLDGLICGPPDAFHGFYYDSFDRVPAYFLDNGPNPFRPESLRLDGKKQAAMDNPHKKFDQEWENAKGINEYLRRN